MSQIIQQYRYSQMRIIQQYFRQNVDLEPWFLFELLTAYHDNLILYQHLSLENYKVKVRTICPEFASEFSTIDALPIKRDYGTDAICIKKSAKSTYEITCASQMKYYTKTSRITYKHMCSFICHGRMIGAPSLTLYCLPESKMCNMAEYLLQQNEVQIVRRSMKDLLNSKKIRKLAKMNDLL